MIDCPTMRWCQASGIPLFVQAGRNPVVPHGAIVTGPHVVFAGADHLDRLPDRLGHLDRFDHEIRTGAGPATETAPQKGGLKGDLLRLAVRPPAPQHSGPRSGTGCRYGSGSCPFQIHEAVERLHGGMGQIGHLVLRLEALLRLVASTAGASPSLRATRPGVAARCGILLVHGGVEMPAPSPSSQTISSSSRPFRAGQKPSATTATPASTATTCLTPGQRHGLGGIETFDLAAEDRRPGDNGGQHAGHLYVDAENGRTVDLGRAVQSMSGLPSSFLRPDFSFGSFGTGRLAALSSQLAEAELSTGRAMTNAVFGPAGGRIDLPLPGCRRDQHLTGRSSGQGEPLPLGAHAGTAAGNHDRSELGMVVLRSHRRRPEMSPSSSRSRALRPPASGARYRPPAPSRTC